ncbi:hypothetical protein HHE06_05630 [Helicobacter heilmannii]|nr:hypothetical protein HHE06_05630 [Helicobacter heilmannii]
MATKILNISIGIHTNKIEKFVEKFLDNLIASFSQDLLEYASHF